MIHYQTVLMWVFRVGAIGMGWLVLRSLHGLSGSLTSVGPFFDSWAADSMHLVMLVVPGLCTMAFLTVLGLLFWLKSKQFAHWLLKPDPRRKMLKKPGLSVGGMHVGMPDEIIDIDDPGDRVFLVEGMHLSRCWSVLWSCVLHGLGCLMIYMANFDMLGQISTLFFMYTNGSSVDLTDFGMGTLMMGMGHALFLAAYAVLMVFGVILLYRSRIHLKETMLRGGRESQVMRCGLGIVYLSLAMYFIYHGMDSMAMVFVALVSLVVSTFTGFSGEIFPFGLLAGGAFILIVIGFPIAALRYAVIYIRRMPLEGLVGLEGDQVDHFGVESV